MFDFKKERPLPDSIILDELKKLIEQLGTPDPDIQERIEESEREINVPDVRNCLLISI